jgi:hypothetical protein
MAYNFQIENNGIKLLTEYESADLNVLFYVSIYLSGRKYDVMPEILQIPQMLRGHLEGN